MWNNSFKKTHLTCFECKSLRSFITGPVSLAEQISPEHGCSPLLLVPLLQPDHYRNGGRMVEMWFLFRSIDSVARGLGGPWTWWIGSSPVQLSGCCLGAALSWFRDGLLAGVGCSSLILRFSWTVTLIILGLGFLRARLLRLCCTAAFPPIFQQLCKGQLWSCVELLPRYALCSFDQCRTVKLRLIAVRELFWVMLGRGDGGWRGIGVSGSGYNEVLALEVRNVVWLRRTKETYRASCVCTAPRAFAAAPSFQACLRAFICMCVCIYVYMRMCADMYICIHMHVCMYLYIYAFSHMCMCMCMHICA